MRKFVTLVVAMIGATALGCGAANGEQTDKEPTEQSDCADDTSSECERAKPATPTDEKVTPNTATAVTKELGRWTPTTDF